MNSYNWRLYYEILSAFGQGEFVGKNRKTNDHLNMYIPEFVRYYFFEIV